MTCATCIHFLSRGVSDASATPKPTAKGEVGVCRRYPPKLLQLNWDDLAGCVGASGFPAVHQDHRCGEYVGSESAALIAQAGSYRPAGAIDRDLSPIQ